ncbi:hypothetical protein V6N12_005835 [Hibiscus sabdariffa]|uniref:Uncharacterized protein n=1 Tax=Hibiscus sabdariffa TaxID=183260 RepID=A0ABR2EW74_9ROSI
MMLLLMSNLIFLVITLFRMVLMSVDPGGLASIDVSGVSVVLAPELIVSSDVIQNVLADTSVQSVDDLNSVEFPTLQDSAKKKGKGRGKGEKNKRFAGSSNKFEALVEDIGGVGGRPPRAAAAGVANVLLEMKAKKNDHVLKAKSVSEVPVGGGGRCVGFFFFMTVCFLQY